MKQITPSEVSKSSGPTAEQGAQDAPLWTFDDEALERALKAVHWNERDVSNFLRGTAAAC